MALESPDKFFDNLFRYIISEQFLKAALVKVFNSNDANTAGIDGLTKASVKNTDAFVRALSNALKCGTYQPKPVLRVLKPKTNGQKRATGIACLQDRIVQESCKMLLEPIYESIFVKYSLGFRPNRRSQDVQHLITYYCNEDNKYYWVVQSDITNCFDNIPHTALYAVLKQKIVCKRTTKLIKSWLNSGLFFKGKVSKPVKGVVQSGVLASLLYNIFLHELDKYYHNKYNVLEQLVKNETKKLNTSNVTYIRYADDCLILTNGIKEKAQTLKIEFEQVCHSLSLELNCKTTTVTNVQDGFDFLGYHFITVFSELSNKWFCLSKPNKTSIEQYKKKVKAILSRSNTGSNPALVFKAINLITKNWENYHKFGNSTNIFYYLSNWTNERAYRFLRAKHSNVSAKQSVEKYVIQTYKDFAKHTWIAHGVRLKRFGKTKRYKVNWIKQNPYIESHISTENHKI